MMRSGLTDGRLVAMSKGRDRVLSVSLTEAQWKALVARHPEPAQWLREQVLAQIEGAGDLAGAHGDTPSRPWSVRRV